MVAPVKFSVPGAVGLRIIRTAMEVGAYECTSGNEVVYANKAVGHGYLSRDKKNGKLYRPGPRAEGLIVHLSARDGASEAPAVAQPHAALTVFDSSGLTALIARARDMFDEGDVQAAALLASGGYDQAKAAAGYAARFGAAGKRLVAKARQLQGDALMIETRAQMRIAEEWGKAQAEGRASSGGRPKTVSDDNGFTAEEAGLSRQQIHAARKLLEAETREPGLVERAIAARLAAGLEPSRANLKAQIGTKTATKEERGDNLYETPKEAVHTLLSLEEFAADIWEPACGRAAISRLLEAAGHNVALSDLVDYGTATADGVVQDVIDFLHTTADETADVDIVTNPPYGDVLNAFVAHALRVHRPRKMALLLNLNFLAGFDDPDRNFVMNHDQQPPARIYVFSRRLPMMHRDDWDGPKASSSMNTMWCIWERQEDGGYGNQTITRRVDWADYQPETAESEAV